MLDAVFDLSHFNGQVLDFRPAAAAGLLAVVGKATQGVGYVDPTWAGHRQAALDAGLLTGAYHFGTGDAPGDDQAAFFLRTVGPRIGELLVLDFEENPKGPSMTLAQAVDFADSVHAIAGVWPVLYAGAWLEAQLADAAPAPPSLLACPLWLADYRTVPSLPRGWPSWTLWQWADGHIVPAPPVPGVGLCDRDRFDGDAAALHAFWAAHSAGTGAVTGDPATPKTSAVALLAALVPAVLGAFALCFYATLVTILVFHEVPANNRDIVAGAVGFVGGSLVGCVFGYYFGASLHAKAADAPGVASPTLPRYGA